MSSHCNLAEDLGDCIATPVQIGNVRFDPIARELIVDDVVNRLSTRSVGVLQLLINHAGSVVTRHNLLDQVWSGVTVGDESLTTAVSELRRALKSSRDVVIQTVPKTGYRMVCGNDPNGFDAVPPADNDRSLDAFLTVLEARKLRLSGACGSGVSSVERCYEALALDGHSGIALAQTAISIAFQSLYEADDRSSGSATRYAARAVATHPSSAFALTAQGYALYAVGESVAARSCFARAVARDIPDVDVLSLIQCASMGMGDWRTAIRLGEFITKHNPDGYGHLAIAVRAHEAVNDCRGSTSSALRGRQRACAALEVDPEDHVAMIYLAYFHTVLGDYDAASILLDALPRMNPAFEYYRVLSKTRMSALGDALDDLENIVEQGWRHGRFLLTDPGCQPLFSDPRFSAITRALPA